MLTKKLKKKTHVYLFNLGLGVKHNLSRGGRDFIHASSAVQPSLIIKILISTFFLTLIFST